MGKRFLSTPSARRATEPGKLKAANSMISIHALREEGDPSRFRTGRFFRHFYPRPPRGGRRGSLTVFLSLFIFLSTPSARRATFLVGCLPAPPTFLSTPSARRATVFDVSVFFGIVISIHALREEGDSGAERPPCTVGNFYPRPPRGGRLHPVSFWSGFTNFYPRPPRGGRPPSTAFASRLSKFLSTPSARRATG